jgi:hypothetical protein
MINQSDACRKRRMYGPGPVQNCLDLACRYNETEGHAGCPDSIGDRVYRATLFGAR